MRYILTLLILITCGVAYAGDYHQDDSTHTFIYTVTNSSGNHVTGQTVRITLKSADTINYFDFNDSTWGAFSGLTTPHQTILEDANGGFYFYTLTIDSAVLNSGDYVIIVSNEDSTFADLQAESFNVDRIGNLIKIHR